MNRTELLFLRHGESLGNILKIMTGHTDIPLSERGILQAEAAADYLLTQSIDVIYSSDLQRAYNTALAFSMKSGIEISSVSKELREVYVGEYEGVDIAEIYDRLDPDFALYSTSRFGTYCFRGGESTMEAGERFYKEVLRISKLNLGKRILIASHAGVIRSFWGIISGIPRDRLGDELPFPTNASVSRAIYDGEKILPISYGERDHLKDVGFIDYNKPRV